MVQGLFMKEKKEICILFLLAYTILRLVFLLFINFMKGTIFVFIYLSNLSKEKHFATQTWVINFKFNLSYRIANP